MDKYKLKYYKEKLYYEKDRVEKLIQKMKENETIDCNFQMASELSFYDNHPGDLGAEINDMSRGMALKKHETSIIKRIEDALRDIDENKYGVCRICGVEIPEERLEFLPYTQFCVKCQTQYTAGTQREKGNRPVEEMGLGNPFGLSFKDSYKRDKIAYDEVSQFESYEGQPEYYYDDDGYTDPIEEISNEQYKSQLPD